MDRIAATWKYVKKHPYLVQILLSLMAGIVLATGGTLVRFLSRPDLGLKLLPENLMSILPIGAVIAAFFLYPFVITLYELVYFVWTAKWGEEESAGMNGEESAVINAGISFRAKSGLYDIWVMFLAVAFEWIFLDGLEEVFFEADWYEQLYNSQLHTPIYTKSLPSVLVILALFAVALIILLCTDGKNRPPLLTVLCMGGLYIGVLFSILFTVQIFRFGKSTYSMDMLDAFLLLPPINMILITARLICREVRACQPEEERCSRIDAAPFLSRCFELLKDAKKWPIIAFVLMWPMLGIVVAILTLFGQAPDALIKAFTETADYTFSTKIPPQNIYYDEHYLCTVAAGGHEKVVKPIRMGKRHGHDVVVNRQLCVANAFEQILEEKTPRFHRALRSFYDRYGFPVAKLIRSKYTADLIWFLMKPLEWIFLIVIYLTDVHPEDRIWSQYL